MTGNSLVLGLLVAGLLGPTVGVLVAGLLGPTVAVAEPAQRHDFGFRAVAEL
jgi:hypothetical protein